MHVITCFVKFDTYWQIKVQLNFKGILKTNNFFYSNLICFSLLLHVFENVPHFLPSVQQRLPRSPANWSVATFLCLNPYIARLLADWVETLNFLVSSPQPQKQSTYIWTALLKRAEFPLRIFFKPCVWSWSFSVCLSLLRVATYVVDFAPKRGCKLHRSAPLLNHGNYGLFIFPSSD